MTTTKLDVGDVAPNFTLPDQDGNEIVVDDFIGQKTILYFYPAASTPGCTTEACDFRDNMGSLAGAGYRVLGISKDAQNDLKKFHDNESLSFPLLGDESLAVHEAYGAYGEKSLYGKTVTGTLRSTFVIGEDGRIAHALYNVKATGHVAGLKKKLGLTA